MYFKHFPKEFYRFGDEKDRAVMQNITAYADIVDQVKLNGSYYEDYYIKEGERADTLANTFYKNPQLHWTFYLMNDSLRERGWPMITKDVVKKVQKDYHGLVLNTRENVATKFNVGQSVVGQYGSGTIARRNLQLGQVVLENVSGYFVDGEQITSQGTTLETLLVESSSPEYLSARYYVDADGNKVDIDPFVGPGALVNEVTHQDFYIEENNGLRQIRVIKPSSMSGIASAFNAAMRSL